MNTPDPKNKLNELFNKMWGIDYSKNIDYTAETELRIPKYNIETWEKILKLIQQDIINSFDIELNNLLGIPPIKQTKSNILPPSVKSCICCKHWNIEVEKTYLIGVCLQKGKEKTDYGFICKDWEKI